MNDSSAPFAWSLAVCASVLICLPLSVSGDFALWGEPVDESLKDMPWYDAPQDDYKEYTAEEVREFIPEDSDAPELQMPGRPPGIPQGVQEFVLLIFLGLLIFFSVYLAYRWYREREPGMDRSLRVRKGPRAPEVLDLPGLEEAVDPQVDLRQAILTFLREGRNGKAATYIFVLLLRELSAREFIPLRKHTTAREYARLVAAAKALPGSLRDLFKESAVNFELVVYGESEPELDVPRFWERVQSELKDLSMASTTGDAA